MGSTSWSAPRPPPAQLDALGEELRAAQRSLDSVAIQELSLRRRQLIDALTALREETAVGILLVDRNIDLISQLCGSVVSMSKGRIMHQATASDFAADEDLRIQFLAPVGGDGQPAESRS